MRDITIYLMDAFTDKIGEGNRAGVVFDADDLSTAQMQEIAKFANVSETAFLISAKAGDDFDIHVRYFTPATEVPICGHATIASHYLRSKKLGLSEGTILSKTGVGVLPVGIEKNDDDIKIVMTQGTPEMGEVLKDEHVDEALRALGLSRDDLNPALPVQFASTGHGKVIIPLLNTQRLHGINPDFEGLKNLTKKIGHTGYFVFTFHEDAPYRTHGRMFAPAIGINEDPVTGNGNGPAGLYLSHHGILKFDDQYSYHAVQGEAMGKPGIIEVRVFKEGGNIEKVQVAGAAIPAGQLKYSL